MVKCSCGGDIGCKICGKRLTDKAAAKQLAAKGGRKSRRELTAAQARKTVGARERKRKK